MSVTRDDGSTTPPDGPRSGASEPAPEPAQGPGASFAGGFSIVLTAGFQAALVIAALYGILKLWPHPTPAGLPPSNVAAQTMAQTMAQTPAPGDRVPVSPDSAAPNAGVRVAAADSGNRPPADSTTPSGVRGAPGRLWCDTTAQRGATPVDTLHDPECVSIAGRQYPVWKGQRLLVLVMLAGALGALFRGLSSLALYAGTRMLRVSWLLQYYLQPFGGAMLGLLFFFLFRGGLFSPSASFDSTDPVGFMAVAALVGLFEKEATAKLQQIATALFAPHGQTTERAPHAAPQDEQPGDGDQRRPAPVALRPAREVDVTRRAEV